MRLLLTFTLLTITPSLALSLNLFEGISSYIHGEVKTIRNADIVYKKVEYSDYLVTYQYQFWKIKHQSICANYRNNLLDYSKCTVVAKQLFTDTCTVLQNKKSLTDIRKFQKQMYCTSATTYNPTVASIRSSDKSSTVLYSARDKCNSLILKAMSSKTENDIAKRDQACDEYRKLKNK